MSTVLERLKDAAAAGKTIEESEELLDEAFERELDACENDDDRALVHDTRAHYGAALKAAIEANTPETNNPHGEVGVPGGFARVDDPPPVEDPIDGLIPASAVDPSPDTGEERTHQELTNDGHIAKGKKAEKKAEAPAKKADEKADKKVDDKETSAVESKATPSAEKPDGRKWL